MNAIIEAAVTHSRTVIATLILILISGTYAYITIPKESEPDINIPILYVSLSHEGISPEDAERLLVKPMEQELRDVEGVKEMRSTAYLGGGNVLLEFEAGFNVDIAIADVREKVDIAKPELPDDADEPTVNEVNLSLFPVLIVSLSGNVQERTLLQLARDLQDKIEGIGTVLEAKIAGDRDELVELVVDPLALESYNLNVTDIINLVSRSNRVIAAGSVDTGQGRFSVKVPGLFETSEDILNMPLKVNGDAIVHFKDVGILRRTFKDSDGYARTNGRPAIALEVSKRTGSNIIETIEKVREVVERERAFWPEEVVVSFSQDKSNAIRNNLLDLQNNVISAILLVMVVVVAALGLRSAGLVGIAIPGSFLAGILVLYSIGFTVNMVVLFSLILAVGMLVDGAIVVTEFADRKMGEGLTPKESYALASKRMAWPIIAATATTLAAFLPLMFWPGVVGEFMKFLPITLIATLSASLLMALIFIPALGANLAGFMRFLLPLLSTALGGLLLAQILPALLLSIGLPAEAAGIAGPLGGLAGAGLGLYFGLKLGRMAYRSLNAVRPLDERQEQSLAADAEFDPDAVKGFTGVYLRVLKAALKLPSLVILLAVAMLVIAQIAYAVLGKGVEFFPEVEPENTILQVHGRGNLSIEERDALLRQVENEVIELQIEHGEFHTIFAKSMASSGTGDDEAEDLIGTIQLELTDWFSRRPADVIIADIRERTAPLAGIFVEPRKEEAGPPVGKAVQVQVSSVFPDEIEPVAIQIAKAMEGLGGFVDVEDGRPVPGIEWELAVDRAQAARFGADVTLIGSYVRMVTYGTKLGEFRPDDSNEEIDIVVRLPRNYRNIDQLDRIRIQTDSGLTPISNFVTRTPKPKVGLLRRTDGNRVMTVKADVAPGLLADTKVTEIREWLKTADINPRVEISFKGEDEEQKQAQAFLTKAFIVALFMMAIILVTQFNSFYSAFLILTAVIMSTIGVMMGLLITGQPFGIVMSGIGVIALAGIVVNNNIVLIDTFDRIRETGVPVREAILRTGAQRLRPVLLTTITTILGLMPMVLAMNIDFGSRLVQIGAPSTQWWTQLSSAIVFGLTFATVLTLIFTPSALMLRENLRVRFSADDGGSEDKQRSFMPEWKRHGQGPKGRADDVPAVAE